MSDWIVDNDLHGPAEYLAIDEYLTKTADSPHLRVNSLETPVFLPARRTSLGDIESARGDGYSFSRRLTDGSTISCGDDTLTYSIVIPTDDFPAKVFRERVAPALTNVLENFTDEELKVDTRHDSIRIGDEETPGDISEGRQVSGNGLWRHKNAVLCQGIIPLDSWGENLQYIEMSPEERTEAENLPYIDAEIDEVEEELIDEITSGDYQEMGSEYLQQSEIERLVQEKYGNSDWLEDPGTELVKGEGFCMLDEYENGFY